MPLPLAPVALPLAPVPLPLAPVPLPLAPLPVLLVGLVGGPRCWDLDVARWIIVSMVFLEEASKMPEIFNWVATSREDLTSTHTLSREVYSTWATAGDSDSVSSAVGDGVAPTDR